jgi:opacity protein-like surface antigen
MMRAAHKISAFLFVCFLFSYAGMISAQEIHVDTIKVNKTRMVNIVSVMTVPKLILQLSASYNSGALELTSHNGGFSSLDLTSGKNFGARNGFGVNLTGKIPLNKKGQFWLDVVAGFARFQSDLFAQNSQEGKVSYNSFNGGAGIEYNFTSYHRVKYYFGLNPLVSVISGKATLINQIDNTQTIVTIKSNVRVGYSVYMGLEYAFTKDIGMNAGLRFTHTNLLMKKTVDPGANYTQVDLNDGATSAFNPIPFGGWKQFAYISAYAGISYFFGVKVNRYKLP